MTVVVLAVCLFPSFYFAFLSFQAVDDASKKQLVFLAASSLITGVMILACLTVYSGIKKAVSGVEISEETAREPTEYDED